MNIHKLDDFTEAYIECALWSSTDQSSDSGGEPLDDNYDASDIAPETLEKMVADCKAFQGDNWDYIKSDWPKVVGKRLTQDSKVYGSFDLYVGDDNLIHGQ